MNTCTVNEHSNVYFYYFSLLVKVGASPDSVPSRQSMSQ